MVELGATPPALPGSVLDHLPRLIDGALNHDALVFEVFHTLHGASAMAWIVIVGAALSQALGRSAILLLNRVRPSNFVYALLAVAVSLGAGLVLWLLSTWLLASLFFGVQLPFGTVARTLGLACLPLWFAVVVAMPYFGLAAFVVLAFWCLLGVATGLSAVSGLTFAQAMLSATLGWVAWQVLERTLGRPVVAIGRRLERRAAGVELKTDVLALAALLTEEAEEVEATLVEEVREEVQAQAEAPVDARAEAEVPTLVEAEAQTPVEAPVQARLEAPEVGRGATANDAADDAPGIAPTPKERS